MPGQITSLYCLLNMLALFGRRLLQVLVKKPGTCSPDITIAAGPPQLTGKSDRFGEKFREVALNHRCLCIDEARVEVALEHHQNPFDRSFWGMGRRVRAQRQSFCGKRSE